MNIRKNEEKGERPKNSEARVETEPKATEAFQAPVEENSRISDRGNEAKRSYSDEHVFKVPLPPKKRWIRTACVATNDLHINVQQVSSKTPCQSPVSDSRSNSNNSPADERFKSTPNIILKRRNVENSQVCYRPVENPDVVSISKRKDHSLLSDVPYLKTARRSDSPEAIRDRKSGGKGGKIKNPKYSAKIAEERAKSLIQNDIRNCQRTVTDNPSEAAENSLQPGAQDLVENLQEISVTQVQEASAMEIVTTSADTTSSNENKLNVSQIPPNRNVSEFPIPNQQIAPQDLRVLEKLQ